MMCCLSNTFAQCVIPITNDQPYIEGFEDGGFDCWSVEENGGSWSAIAGTESTVAYFTYHNTGDEARLISPTEYTQTLRKCPRFSRVSASQFCPPLRAL